MRRVRLCLLLCMALVLLLSACSANNANDAAANAPMESTAAAGDSKSESIDIMFSEVQRSEDRGENTGSTDSYANDDSPADSEQEQPSPEPTRLDANIPGAAPDAMDRKIIYKANIAMKVKKYNDTQSAIRDLVHINNGYILQFSDHDSMHEKGGTFVIKIPSRGFTSFINELERMKPLTLQRSVEGQDVTEEFVDLGSRLKAKQVVEARLLSFMEKATKASDLVSFSNELGRVQEEIEQIKGRMRYLEQNVAYSTIELRVYESEEGSTILEEKEKPAYQRAVDALQGSLNGIGNFFEALLVFIAGAIPVLLLLSIFSIPVFLFYRRYRRELALKPIQRRESPTDAGTPPASVEETPEEDGSQK